MFEERTLVIQQQEHNIKQFMQYIEHFDQQKASALLAKGYQYIKTAQRTVTFTFGTVTFSRRAYMKSGEVLYPVDQELKLLPYVRFSAELMFELSAMASHMSYRAVAKYVSEFRHIEVTKDTVFKAVKMATKLYAEKDDYQYYKDEELIAKIKPAVIYIEGDGIQVKTPKGEDKRTDLAHFVIHEGSKSSCLNRRVLQNKYEIIEANNRVAREKLQNYLYNHYQINHETVMVTNSDMESGYTPYIFKEIAKMFHAHHEHFWDTHHLNVRVNEQYKNLSLELREELHHAIVKHDKHQTRVILDTTESMIEDEQELEKFQNFKGKLLQYFQYTKPAYLRCLSHAGIGIIESQNSKIAFRMKHRGMYWSQKGAVTMAKLVIDVNANRLRELYFGDWRDNYAQIQAMSGKTTDYLRDETRESGIKIGKTNLHRGIY